jgi:hypothetical protein
VWPPEAQERLFEARTADPAFGEVRRVLVDSTIVPPWNAAGGGARKKVEAGWSAKALALFRSRGGLSPKVVEVAAGEDTVLAVDVVPG